jgi:hypothetical protein
LACLYMGSVEIGVFPERIQEEHQRLSKYSWLALERVERMRPMKCREQL